MSWVSHDDIGLDLLFWCNCLIVDIIPFHSQRALVWTISCKLFIYLFIYAKFLRHNLMEETLESKISVCLEINTNIFSPLLHDFFT